MRIVVLLMLIIFISLWSGLASYLTGYISAQYLPDQIALLTLPKTTTELGDSLAIIDGLFSSIAIVLGLIAILLQGKELKESTKAQTEQAVSLIAQIKQQQESNKLGAYSARLQFLLAEIERLEKQIKNLIVQLETKDNAEEEKKEKWNIVKNSRNLQVNYREQAKSIDQQIQDLLQGI